MLLPNQRLHFDIPSGITYLNCAYMSPLLNRVKEAGIVGMNKKSHPWSIHTDDWFSPGEELRALFATIIGADTENIAIIPSVSYGIAIAAKNISLDASQQILLLDQQYPSNVYAWRELSAESGAEIITVKRLSGQTWTEAIRENINEHTGLIAIPNCHWTDGSLIDLEEISKQAKSVNAKLVIDASQSLGAYPLDVTKIKPDFLVTVGYKWLIGPYGLGYLYCDQKYCESGRPIENPWLNRKGSEDFKKLVDYQDEFKGGGRRFDGGEYPDFVRIPMAIAALTQVLDWGVSNIQETLALMIAEIESVASRSGYEVHRGKNGAGHMIGIRIPDGQVSAIAKRLSNNDIHVSFRGTNMRVSPHLYNDLDDVKRLFKHL